MEENALFSDAQAWGDGSDGSMGRGKCANLRKKVGHDQHEKLVKISKEAKREGSGSGWDEGGAQNENVYNDTKLSRTQPWRLRYPTPHDLKEQLSHSSAEEDGA